MKMITPRLLLRPFRATDAEDVFAYASDGNVTEKAGWRAHESLDETRRVLALWMAECEKYALVLRETGRVIGHVSVEPDSEEARADTRELGFMLLARYQRQGLMTEAVRAVVQILFSQGVAYVWACCFTDNHASKKLIEKCGFVFQQAGKYYSESLDKEFDTYEYRRENTLQSALAAQLREGAMANLTLQAATPREGEALCAMQARCFRAMLEKYRDTETNPAAEPLPVMRERLETPGQDAYFIMRGSARIGFLLIDDRGAECYLVRIGILPAHQNKGYAQRAIALAEGGYPSAKTWVLDTILQEPRLCHLYEKAGYRDTGKREHIRAGMDLALYVKSVQRELIPG